MGTRSDLPQDFRGSDRFLGGSASCWTGRTRGKLEDFDCRYMAEAIAEYLNGQ